MGIVQRVGIFHQGAVDEVGALFLQDVQEAEGEFQFGIEFEEGQIDVAAHAHLDEAVEGLCGDGAVLVAG